MLKNAREIKIETLEKLNESYKNDRLTKAMQNACSKTSINTISYVNKAKVGNYDQFSINIKTMKVTNQKASGRCWIFAGCNVLREEIAKKCNIEQFELSQNFIAFYDKIEKINYVMESVLDLIDKPSDDRTLYTIMRMPVGDGGQWDMFVSLVKKYGVCPKNVMDETFSSSNTRESSFIINTMLRKFAATAQKLHQENKDDEILKLKNETLEKLYKVLTIAFGTPTKEFDFEYVDKDGLYHLEKGYTPKSFYDKFLGDDYMNQFVSLINAPTMDKPYNQTFTVDYIGNVIGGTPILYLNLPMSELKEAVLKQLKAGEIVWFGSDCSKAGDRENGMWDIDQYDYVSSLNVDISMEKDDMLNYGQSAMNHAMVITGVNLDDGKSTKWKIENSWGSEIAHQGYFTATDKWFDNYVYQAVINKKHLTKEQLKNLEKEPKHLNPWDPMGTLAD